MKNAWACLLLLLYIETSQGILKCNKNDNCLCIPGQEFEFQCPKSNGNSGLDEGFIIHVIDQKKVEIDCTTDQFDETILPNITTSNIEYFRIRFCPLPKISFREILNRFSIKKLDWFQFSSSKNAINLTKDYLAGLDQVLNLRLISINLSELEDDIFANTPNLVSLELQENRLQITPNLFNYTPMLKSLDLSGNKLVSIPGGTFGSLQNLKYLHLWGNNLTTLDEFTFEGLYQLNSLELSANMIENISEKAFYNLTDLKEINLSVNKLEILPSRLFFNNKKLNLIRMNRNSFKSKLSDELFSSLPELEQIDLINCQIDIIPEHIFENTTNLKHIQLQNNHIINLPQGIFKTLQNLEEINLNDNRIEDISNVFASLTKLKKLFLRKNAITEIRPGAFDKLYNLDEIDLSYNQITNIHFNTFNDKKNLKKINLSHNLYSQKGIYAILEGVVAAEEINLSYNLITQFDDVIPLYNKVNLIKLDLSNNRITNISLKDLQPMGKKISINLENNNITMVSFENVETMVLQGEKKDAINIFNTYQSVIDISNNPIDCDCLNYDFLLYLRSEITPEIRTVYDIRGKNLTCANPPELKDILVENLDPSLLSCRLEKYTECPDECSCSWRPFDTTMIIDCANKNLVQYPEFRMTPSFDFPFNQTEMHLEENSLEVGPDRNLTGYENVTKLFLSHNKIRNISWIPPRVEMIYLDNNKITSLDDKILNFLNASNYFSKLSLNNNPWTCDCTADYLSNFLRHNTRQVETKNILCSNTTRRLIDLNRNDLCHEWQNVYTALLVMLFLLLVASTMAAYYRYQEEIKAWLWLNNYCLWWVGDEDVKDKDKIYDAFISYSHKDEDYVIQNLLPVLEGGPDPFNLCLHGRNWVPGEFIAKQVTNSVMESRRTIIILSQNFLESVWGLMEFHTAHSQAKTDGRPRVIVVLYGDIDMDKLDPELKLYLKTNTYVKWGDPFFWIKLKYAIHNKKCKTSTVNATDISQKHANIMNVIDDKFKLVAPVTTNPGSTPPVLTLDPILLKKHPLNFVPSPELNTPPAETGNLLTTTNT